MLLLFRPICLRLHPLANMKNTTIVMEGRSTAKASSDVVSSVSGSQTFTKNLPGIGNKTYTVSNLIYSSYPSIGGIVVVLFMTIYINLL